MTSTFVILSYNSTSCRIIDIFIIIIIDILKTQIFHYNSNVLQNVAECSFIIVSILQNWQFDMSFD